MTSYNTTSLLRLGIVNRGETTSESLNVSKKEHLNMLNKHIYWTIPTPVNDHPNSGICQT